MGVVNATPDSFSDGARYFDPVKAVGHGLQLWRQGAHLVDVGGESTRPGAPEVPAAEELRRVVPVVEGLVSSGVRVSIDTSKARVAEAAVAAGASVVNDVTGLRDPEMARVCAAGGVGVVLMHMQGDPRTMQLAPQYEDVVAEVGAFLRRRIAVAEEAGIDPAAIAIDPGIGFGKTVSHNVTLLAGLPELSKLGRPIVLGVSRKTFLGTLSGRALEDRDGISAVAAGIGAVLGASVLRVHEVPSTRDALALAGAIVNRMDGDAKDG